MIRASFDFDIDVLINAERKLVNSPKLLARAMKRRQPRLRQLALSIVAVEPGPVHYPIRWKSRKQQRAYFATDGFGQGIPYRRTGGLVQAWDAKFVLDAEGGAFVIENTSPIADYVIGGDQMPYHADTGWIRADQVIDNEVVPLILNDIEQTFYAVCDPFVRGT